MSSSLLNEFYEAFHAERRKEGTVDLPERFSFIREQVGKDRDVVELGCRFGDILSLVKDSNRVIGCDIDRNALKISSEKGIETRMMNLNEALDFPDSSFDVAIITEVLEHLPYPKITLSEIVRILRPGGRLVGSVPNAIHLRNRLSFLAGGPVERDPTHLHHFSTSSLKKLLGAHFHECRVEPVGGRYVAVSKELFANCLLFVADGPRKPVENPPR